VLILSEFAGAASQLHQAAVMVNPYDRVRTADAIHQAFCMGNDERQARMRRLRRSVQRNDIIDWVNSFLRAGISRDLKDFPQVELFVPSP
jgi:trehalose 6-phosphate synthase